MKSASIFLPKEHGSWAFALEPLALGLLVAPTRAGGALALATMAGFFARRPLKTLLSLAGRPAAQLTAARMALAVWGGGAAVGLAETVLLGDTASLWPLALVAPCAVVFVQFDRRNEAREAAAELAGATAFALLPAVLATLAGWSAPAALALAALMLGRSLPTIVSVRASLRRAKGESASLAAPGATAGAALAGTVGLIVAGLVPALAAGGAALLFARSGWMVSPWRPAWTARRIGLSEAVLGFVYVGWVATAYLSPTFLAGA